MKYSFHLCLVNMTVFFLPLITAGDKKKAIYKAIQI
jgi:hypothetical protein